MKNKTSVRKRRQLVARWKCDRTTSVLEAMGKLLPDSSRTSHKQYLRDRCLKLNGEVCTSSLTEVNEGDLLELFSVGFLPPLFTPEIKLLWEDDYFILVQKEAGLHTISTREGEKRTVFRLVADYYKAGNSTEKIFLLNRLDRETPGLILFARNREIQQEVLENWGKYVLAQSFTALVEGVIPNEEGELTSLSEASTKMSQSKVPNKKKNTSHAEAPRRSRVSYQVLERGQWRTLLYLTLHGRYNGIRSQLSEKGNPIMGEKNKGCLLRSTKELAITQSEMLFLHPVTGKRHHFKLETPEYIYSLLKGRLTSSERAAIQEKETPVSEKAFNLSSIKPIKRT
ncbi:pseudouridine synthase [Porphyromonas circumdentaria]|uniref:23S rRNA pseudouridine1911/1915/1917 synthase n=1 Tax=Porphyromonas circumdentaria TaxID=29524 RepID=A0A1T4N5X7_9PORP|nr:pseudouridine synthase [Porphyromonas circumdentaria]MBB6276045.1 23S rRNA pseudouridine1911/1915/1917 synthase [Porphyromonas circumdentaria]MDO4722435.1 pseudouridine synthase [Porphyromonas circumdentaria]SJZ74541.1 23S rRNA pseudouridine1911/1915/1917 synthase [Porphyromonas circumdentaria]